MSPIFRQDFAGPLGQALRGQQAVAVLKAWRLLRKLCYSTTRITDLVKAVLTLHMGRGSRPKASTTVYLCVGSSRQAG
jgi:hypothetical protein